MSNNTTTVGILEKGLADGSVIKTDMARKLTIGGITKTFPVYKVRLDMLYYNDQNDRIATWISQYRTEHNGQEPDMGDLEAYNHIIEQFIIASNREDIVKTRDNISQVDQREPAVVLYDGRIIDGNRRFTCLRSLAQENDKFNYLETIILDRSEGSNIKQIKMLELSIQHGEEGKIDYNPVDLLVGLYHDIVETKLLSVAEYARSTNEKPGAVQKSINIAKLMVEYLEFINAPKQFHIVRDLQLLFPLEELAKMLKKCQSNDEAEDLKVCVFTNILMRTSSDLGRFVRKIKNVKASPFYEEYISEQLEIAEEVLEKLPESGKVTSEALRETVKSNIDLTQKLEKSIDKALTKVRRSESQSRPVDILENVNSLLTTITVDMFDDFTPEDFPPVEEQLIRMKAYIEKIQEYIGE